MAVPPMRGSSMGSKTRRVSTRLKVDNDTPPHDSAKQIISNTDASTDISRINSNDNTEQLQITHSEGLVSRTRRKITPVGRKGGASVQSLVSTNLRSGKKKEGYLSSSSLNEGKQNYVDNYEISKEESNEIENSSVQEHQSPKNINSTSRMKESHTPKRRCRCLLILLSLAAVSTASFIYIGPHLFPLAHKTTLNKVSDGYQKSRDYITEKFRYNIGVPEKTDSKTLTVGDLENSSRDEESVLLYRKMLSNAFLNLMLDTPLIKQTDENGIIHRYTSYNEFLQQKNSLLGYSKEKASIMYTYVTNLFLSDANKQDTSINDLGITGVSVASKSKTKNLEGTVAFIEPKDSCASSFVSPVISTDTHPTMENVSSKDDTMKTSDDNNETGTAYITREVSEGGTLLYIPRHMILSSYDSHPIFMKKCFLPLGSNTSSTSSLTTPDVEQTKCRPSEILLLQILHEIALQKFINKSFEACDVEGKGEIADSAHNRSQRSHCPHRSCFIYSNKQNAPYFSSIQMQAATLVLPHSSNRLTDVIKTLKGLVTTFEELFIPNDGTKSSIDSKTDSFIIDTTTNSTDSENNLSLEDDDFQQALSIVMSRSLWDVGGNAAITPFDYMIELHWDTNLVVTHNATDDGFTWKAPRHMGKADKLLTGQGTYNNLRLLYQYGKIIPKNPWGPVWFLRKFLGDDPKIRASPRKNEEAKTIPFIKTIEIAEALLPLWALENVSLTDVPVHYFRNGGEVSHTTGMIPHKNLSIECDIKTFYASKTYKHGSIVLHRDGPVGGFASKMYVCVREMKYKEIESSVKREKKVALLFKDLCSAHKKTVKEANKLIFKSFKDNVSEHNISKLFSTALDEELNMMEKCIHYFDTVIRNLGV